MTPARIALIDYGSGNLHSARKAVERAATDAGLSVDVLVTHDPATIRGCDRIILPGVGAFADCARGLRAVSELVEALEEAVHKQGKPFLGICVGMQLLASRGLEHGITEGLGWIKGDVRQIELSDPGLKIPHMGWNTLHPQREHSLTQGLDLGAFGWHAYFVHSYAFEPKNLDDVVAVTNYGGPVTALIAKDNIAGTQFHPEKSQKLGLGLLANFLRWQP
jgi:imidazole glycerol-phosphate synthase subunit HisH